MGADRAGARGFIRRRRVRPAPNQPAECGRSEEASAHLVEKGHEPCVDLCIRSIEALLPGAAEEGGAEGGGSNAARQVHPRPSEPPRPDRLEG